jgi:hypothetical protein
MISISYLILFIIFLAKVNAEFYAVLRNKYLKTIVNNNPIIRHRRSFYPSKKNIDRYITRLNELIVQYNHQYDELSEEEKQFIDFMFSLLY